MEILQSGNVGFLMNSLFEDLLSALFETERCIA